MKRYNLIIEDESGNIVAEAGIITDQMDEWPECEHDTVVWLEPGAESTSPMNAAATWFELASLLPEVDNGE